MKNNAPVISGKPVIFFDVETNGLSKTSSVLSITAIKAFFNGTDIEDAPEIFTRFYYRQAGEPVNREALAVNGLTDKVIRKNRGDAQYAEHFIADGDFTNLCAGVDHYVGHNISFDRMFVRFPLKHCFCTMRENTSIIRLKRYNGGLKYPSLSETAAYYALAPESGKLHTSEYDTWLVYEIFRKMLAAARTKRQILNFLKK